MSIILWTTKISKVVGTVWTCYWFAGSSYACRFKYTLIYYLSLLQTIAQSNLLYYKN